MTNETPRRRHWEQYRIEPNTHIKLLEKLLDSTSNLSPKEALKVLRKLHKVQQTLELKLYKSGNNLKD